ncbi:MAG: M20/M25/M40 family metallo-hydrolase [Streptosporangiales bacterium]|nr:M20/M25/M40 family metallo-hydrolase [Streptosporangiales bacterium]
MAEDRGGTGAREPAGWVAGLVALGVLLLLAVVTVWDIRPPAPRPASAPAAEFSAQRAFAHIERFAKAPHPMGTAENDRVRDYLVDELRRLGLRTEVREGVGQWPRPEPGPTVVGRVRNVVAMLEGTAPTGRVFVVAHYDSVPAGPGANDDGSGTAAVLETARALTEDRVRPRNDVVFLLTDGEEPGLLGAEAFVAQHPLARGRTVVLNHEARGAGGPVLMFRATSPNAELIKTLAAAAPHPVADSAMAEAAAQLPNDTDFTAFRLGGMTGLDSAYIGGGAYYHSALDDPAHVGQRSLQQMGDNTLAVTRAFADKDLSTGSADGSAGGDLVFFGIPPDTLVSYPVGLALPLALAGLLAAAGLAAVARRRLLASFPRTAAGTAVALIPIVLAVAAAAVYWPALVAIRPDYANMPTGTPYRPDLYKVAVLALTALIVTGWYAALRRRIGPAPLAVGMVILAAVAGALLAVFSPASSHTAALPALGAAIGGLVALSIRDPLSPWRVVALAAGLVPAAVLLAAGTWPAFDIGISASAFAAVPSAAMFGGLVLPLVELAWPRRRGVLVPVTAAALAVVLTGAGVAVDRPDSGHPVPTSLAYGLNADTGTAVWAVPGPADRWNGRFLRGPARSARPFDQMWGQELSAADAPAAELPAPELTVLQDTAGDGERTLRVRVRSLRSASAIGLYVDGATARVHELTVAGRRIRANLDEQDSVGSRFGFRFEAPAEGAVEATLVVSPRGGRPVRIRVADFTVLPDALGAVPGYAPPPEGMYLRFGATAVTRAYTV